MGIGLFLIKCMETIFIIHLLFKEHIIMNNRIKDARLSFTCHQNWDTMKSNEEGRFCDTCEKKVYDLTDKSVAYFMQILHENNNSVCGRFTKDQMSKSTPVNNSYWKKWTITAMVFLGFGATAQKTNAQEAVQDKTLLKTTEPSCDSNSFTLGMIIPPLDHEEMRSLYKYLIKNCNVPVSTNGRLIASFKLSADGRFTNIAISEQLDGSARAEVERLLKAAPKWKKKDLGYIHSISITFKDGKILPEY